MRQRLIDAALVFLFGVTGSGCTQFAPYRTQTLADNGLLKEARCYSGDPHSNCLRAKTKKQSLPVNMLSKTVTINTTITRTRMIRLASVETLTITWHLSSSMIRDGSLIASKWKRYSHYCTDSKVSKRAAAATGKS